MTRAAPVIVDQAEAAAPPGIERAGTIPQMISARATLAPAHVAFRVLRDELLVNVRTAAFLAEVRALAKGLVAVGVRSGDRVAIMSATRYEWTLCECAILFAGAIVVPIHETSSEAQIAHVMADADVTHAFVEHTRGAAAIDAARGLSDRPRLPLWVMSRSSNDLNDLVERGRGVTDAVLDAQTHSRGVDDVASIVHTSGATAEPRGALITHGNVTRLCVSVKHALPEVLNDESSTVMVLPLAHILARFVTLAGFWCGTTITHARDASRLAVLMTNVRPTVMVAVPSVLTKILGSATRQARLRHLGEAFEQARQVTVSEGRRDLGAAAEPRPRGWKRWLTDQVFNKQLRDELGGRLSHIICGAAPLDDELGLFFQGLGVEVLEGYGLTESTGPVTVNRPGRVEIGSVGEPLPGCTVAIDETGEVLLKGPGVVSGYVGGAPGDDLVDGWLATGDLGSLEHGCLTITGRAKNLIVTDTGKNISPQRWEARLEAHPLVKVALMVGDRRPYASAVLVLDADALAEWARSRGRRDLARLAVDPPAAPGRRIDDPDLMVELDPVVQAANADLSPAERVRGYVFLVADLDDALTPTQKPKRAMLTEVFGDLIDELYL